MIERDEDARKIASYVDSNLHTILNCMRVYSEHMTREAERAQAAHDAGQLYPRVRAEQDKSMMTNAGYAHAARLFTVNAESARQVAKELEALFDTEEQDG